LGETPIRGGIWPLPSDISTLAGEASPLHRRGAWASQHSQAVGAANCGSSLGEH